MVAVQWKGVTVWQGERERERRGYRWNEIGLWIDEAVWLGRRERRKEVERREKLTVEVNRSSR